MLRLGIYFHVIFGMIFLFLFFPMGVLMLSFAALLILIAVTSRKADILDNWSILISKAHGQREKVFSSTKERIADSKAPNIEMTEEKVGSGLSIQSFGDTRDFLIVTNRNSTKLSNFKAFVNANDYGENLFVSWYLTYRPDFLQCIVLLLPGAKATMSIDDLNLFDKQDLTAYITDVHHSLMEAVEKLMLELKQDPSKIDRKARGFLGIS